MKTFVHVTLTYLCLAISAHAIEPLPDNSEILVYSDGIIAPLLDVAEDSVAKELKAQKIKIKHRKKKGMTTAIALENLEKDVLKKKPSLVLLSVGMADLFDTRKQALLETHDVSAAISNTRSMIKQISDAGIRVVLVTPGLVGEFPEKLASENAVLDDFVAQQKALATELKVPCLDLRSTSLAAVNTAKQQGKYGKKERPYLTKNGIEWDKEGAAALGHKLPSFLGINKSGIGRKIRPDDYIAIFTSFDYAIKKNIENMEIEVKAQFEGQPKAPRLKPVKNAPQYYNKVTEFPEVLNQRASIAIIQLGWGVCTHSTLKAESVIPSYNELMKQLSKSNTTVFFLTPPLPMEKPSNKVDKNGLFYKKSKRVSEIIHETAGKYGFPVVDIFAIMEQYHAENPERHLISRNANNGMVFGAAYVEIITKELRKIVGLPEAESIYLHASQSIK